MRRCCPFFGLADGMPDVRHGQARMNIEDPLSIENLPIKDYSFNLKCNIRDCPHQRLKPLTQGFCKKAFN